jgi:hypothetical protein
MYQVFTMGCPLSDKQGEAMHQLIFILADIHTYDSYDLSDVVLGKLLNIAASSVRCG